MKRYLYSSLFLLVLTACWSRDPSKIPNPDPNHTHADFLIWIDGMTIDFSDAKYMSRAVTDDHTSSGTTSDDHKHDYLHLHDGVGYVIHRHKPDLSLGEFFDSLGFGMSSECFIMDDSNHTAYCNGAVKKWRLHVNGEEQTFDPAYVFEDLDHMLLTFGADDEVIEELLEDMTDDACLYSQRCPWRGDPPVENCIADPEVPCVLPEDDL